MAYKTKCTVAFSPFFQCVQTLNFSWNDWKCTSVTIRCNINYAVRIKAIQYGNANMHVSKVTNSTGQRDNQLLALESPDVVNELPQWVNLNVYSVLLRCILRFLIL